jgi:hypothetical protein
MKRNTALEIYETVRDTLASTEERLRIDRISEFDLEVEERLENHLVDKILKIAAKKI